MPACEEIGRVSRALVSAHTRTRVRAVRLFPSEKRCLVADFNGALPADRAIAQAVWALNVLGYVGMADGSIAGRAAQVTITAAWRGCAAIRCEVTLDNGEVYNQLFHVEVLPGPYFGDEQTATGPARIVVTP